MQVDVRRVPLEAAGLLEVNAVGVHLAFAFGDERARGKVAPAARFSEFGKQRADVEERERVDRDVGGRRRGSLRHEPGSLLMQRVGDHAQADRRERMSWLRSARAQHQEISRNPCLGSCGLDLLVAGEPRLDGREARFGVTSSPVRT